MLWVGGPWNSSVSPTPLDLGLGIWDQGFTICIVYIYALSNFIDNYHKKIPCSFNCHHQLSSKVLTFGQKHYPNLQFIFPPTFLFRYLCSKSLQKIKTRIPLRINRKWDTQAYNKLFYVIKEQKNNETWDIECRPPGESVSESLFSR